MTARNRGSRALCGAAFLSALLALVWYVSFHSADATRLNLAIVSDARSLSVHAHLAALAQFVTRLIEPSPYVFLAVVPVILSLCRRLPIVALVIVAIIAGATVTTELLKPLLATQLQGGGPVDPGSFPSGHVTAATALALCMVLASPPLLRSPVALAGAAFVAVVAGSVVMLGWHYPSDVVGGVLVASTWWLLGIAAIAFAEVRRPRLAGRRVEVGEGALG
jgi:membrane-associated phospholipid phosphatase